MVLAVSWTLDGGGSDLDDLKDRFLIWDGIKLNFRMTEALLI